MLSPERNQCCLRSACACFSQNVNNADYVLGKARTCVMVFSKMAEDGNSGRRIVV